MMKETTKESKRYWKYWTTKEENYLKNNYKTLDMQTLMQDLGKSSQSIKTKCLQLKLAKGFPSENQVTGAVNMLYKDEVIDFVRGEYSVQTLKEMIDRNIHRIRPAILRGEKIVIEMER